MRTTLRLDDHLLRQAKAEAARCGRSLTVFVEEALRSQLLPSAAKTKGRRIKLPTFKLRLRPGVDVSNNRALRDFLDDNGKFSQC